MGSAAARLFLSAGFSVEGWTRGGTLPGVLPNVVCRAVDLGDATQVEAAPGSFDVVVQAASTRGGEVEDYRRLYLEGARNLKARFPSSAFIFVSSSSVYAQTGGEWVDETSPAAPTHERGEILRAAEDLVLDGGGSVARFAGVYGPGRSVLLRRVLENGAPSDPQPDRYVNQIHREDAAAAVVALADRGTGGQGIWNVVDDEPLLLSECYRWLAARLGRQLRSDATSPRSGKRGDSNKRVKNEKLRAIGWKPAFRSFKEGVGQSLFRTLPSLDSGNLRV